ncbi:glycosyltransferase [Wenzhouxiangella limi]|uniref:Glycosyltransferase n=1 Tax=Wenzhouxiangella limi TaxID=2707351 RepID=A0A845UR77_9GAMM|nr:glycosyltransferase [Wenzhouxiangella limi]NDY94343.1 glycosyltransferase [Wenzhouxiangella limi]
MIQRDRWLKIFYFTSLVLLTGLLAHRAYLYLATPDFLSVHAAQLAKITEAAPSDDELKFAVVGNVNNSVRIFGEEIVPVINAGDYDFVVSAGNAVSSGREESYRAIHRLFRRLEPPYLLTFGENEYSDFGSYRFYEQFGPHFFSFRLKDSLFVFLDGTGKSDTAWQLMWLERELALPNLQNRFVFIGTPLHPPLQETPVFESENYLDNEAFRRPLMDLLESHEVDVVFSANLSVYSRLTIDGVEYITTGGAGGPFVTGETPFHHFVDVTVAGESVSIQPVLFDIHLPAWRRVLDGMWSATYAFFHVSFLRFLLIITALALLAVYLHRLLFENKDYYPDFDVDEAPYRDRSLRVAMYSNNYFPFVSGITVSVDRLRRGLEALGDQVLLFVPRYDRDTRSDPAVERAPTLAAFGNKGEFRLSNLFHLQLFTRLRSFRPDVIHVHHPFWLGSVGLFLGRRLRVPVVYTYHTRLEHYAHFVPLPGPLFRNLISHYLIKRFSNKCDGVIVPTQSAEEYLRMVGVKTTTLIQPTGIDLGDEQMPSAEEVACLRQRLGIAETELVLISVSRLSKEKNIGFMLRCLKKIKSADLPPFRLLLVGEGPGRGQLETLIGELSLQDRVILAGSVEPEHMNRYYALADVFVFASRSETQGMVILEAMAAGLPVLAVRSSGIDDVVQEGKTGFKTTENIDAWGGQLERLLCDSDLRERLSRRALELVRTHDISAFSRNVRNFYVRVMAQYHARGR